MSGATGSENSEAFHVYLHRNLPLYLYNCILVAGFDKPHVFTSLVEPAAVNRMEDYVRNCVVPALTSREERQRYVGLFADKPQLFQISPGHRIQLMMLVKEYRNSKDPISFSSGFGAPVTSNNDSQSSDLGHETFRRRVSENDSAIRLSTISSSKMTSNFNHGSITSNFAGYKRKANDSSPTMNSPVSTTPQGLHLSTSTPDSIARSQHLFKFDTSQPLTPTRGASVILSDDASHSTCNSVESDHMNRIAFQPGNNTTQYASPLSVEEHERRILRLLERWVKAQPDPVIQNLRRDVDFQLTVTRQAENEVVTAKVTCLRCKKSVALVGRGDTWVLSNYHRHLRSCLSNERHFYAERDEVNSTRFSMKSPDSYSGFHPTKDNCDDMCNPSTHPSGSRFSELSGIKASNIQFTLKTESVTSDVSIPDESESENA